MSACHGRALAAAAWVATVILTAVSWGIGAPPAQAHGALVSSTPEDGARLEREPTSVQLTFDDSLRAPAYVVVTAPDGRRISQATPQVLDNRVIEPVTPAGQAGTYTVAYRVVSVDGHAITGDLSYTVTSGATGDEGRTELPTSTQGGASFWTGHWPYVVAAVGGALIAFVVVPRWRRRD